MCGILPEDDYEDVNNIIKIGLVEVVYEWAKKMVIINIKSKLFFIIIKHLLII